MSDPLATYLHDHLAGAALAIDLLKSMQRNNTGEPLGQFAKSLLADIETVTCCGAWQSRLESGPARSRS
jgi:hypothetical protein